MASQRGQCPWTYVPWQHKGQAEKNMANKLDFSYHKCNLWIIAVVWALLNICSWQPTAVWDSDLPQWSACLDKQSLFRVWHGFLVLVHAGIKQGPTAGPSMVILPRTRQNTNTCPQGFGWHVWKTLRTRERPTQRDGLPILGTPQFRHKQKQITKTGINTQSVNGSWHNTWSIRALRKAWIYY
jgi:hypothetical protein